MNWKFWKNEVEIEDEDYEEEYRDRLTKKDVAIVLFWVFLAIFTWQGANLAYDKVKCAYKGHTYEKKTKRPIFSECLIQMKDGSYVPVERYINRVLTFNDLSNNIEQ